MTTPGPGAVRNWYPRMGNLSGVFIGAITFTGSIIAYGKLARSIDGKPLTLPGRHMHQLRLDRFVSYLGFMFLPIPVCGHWS